MHFAVVLVY